jgi:rhodanese-related sulfurtransferase
VGTRTTIGDRLAQARENIDRFTPSEAKAAAAQGAVIVDTRCAEDRRREGLIRDAVEVPLSVLEWRCDPESGYADDRLADLHLQIIVMCNDGFSSSLAAASLRDLGFGRAGDMIGGFRAWMDAGLPVTPP